MARKGKTTLKYLLYSFIALILYSSALYIAFMYMNKGKNNANDDSDRIDNPDTSTPTDENESIDENSSNYIEKEEPAPDNTETTTVKPEIVWGNRNKKQIIFTFDAGSGSQSINKILSTLDKYDVTGTFFLTGKWASQNPTLTSQISSKGHEIYNHTYNHPDLTKVTDQTIIQEFKTTEDLIKQLTGRTSKPFFRPPYGSRNTHIKEVAAQQGYQSVYWTVDALDWKESSGVTATQVKTRIYSNLAPGTIYLMHVGDNITGNILDEVFQYVLNKGYKIVSLSEGIK